MVSSVLGAVGEGDLRVVDDCEWWDEVAMEANRCWEKDFAKVSSGVGTCYFEEEEPRFEEDSDPFSWVARLRRIASSLSSGKQVPVRHEESRFALGEDGPD